jgi:hypothetical protein
MWRSLRKLYSHFSYWVAQGSTNKVPFVLRHPLPIPHLVSIRAKLNEESDTIDMVAPLSCPGTKVEILVDGQPLQGYDDVDADTIAPNTTTKYIEAQSNARFAVRVIFNHDFPFPAGAISVKITLDGQHTEEALILGRNLLDRSGTIIDGLTTRIGPDTDARHDFRFVTPRLR